MDVCTISALSGPVTNSYMHKRNTGIQATNTRCRTLLQIGRLFKGLVHQTMKIAEKCTHNHPRCRGVFFFIWKDLEKSSITCSPMNPLHEWVPSKWESKQQNIMAFRIHWIQISIHFCSRRYLFLQFKGLVSLFF